MGSGPAFDLGDCIDHLPNLSLEDYNDVWEAPAPYPIIVVNVVIVVLVLLVEVVVVSSADITTEEIYSDDLPYSSAGVTLIPPLGDDTMALLRLSMMLLFFVEQDRASGG